LTNNLNVGGFGQVDAEMFCKSEHASNVLMYILVDIMLSQVPEFEEEASC